MLMDAVEKNLENMLRCANEFTVTDKVFFFLVK